MVNKVSKPMITEYLKNEGINVSVDHGNDLVGGQAAFITPEIAKKIIDFVYLNSHRQVISHEVNSR